MSKIFATGVILIVLSFCVSAESLTFYRQREFPQLVPTGKSEPAGNNIFKRTESPLSAFQEDSKLNQIQRDFQGFIEQLAAEQGVDVSGSFGSILDELFSIPHDLSEEQVTIEEQRISDGRLLAIKYILGKREVRVDFDSDSVISKVWARDELSTEPSSGVTSRFQVMQLNFSDLRYRQKAVFYKEISSLPDPEHLRLVRITELRIDELYNPGESEPFERHIKELVSRQELKSGEAESVLEEFFLKGLKQQGLRAEQKGTFISWMDKVVEIPPETSRIEELRYAIDREILKREYLLYVGENLLRRITMNWRNDDFLTFMGESDWSDPSKQHLVSIYFTDKAGEFPFYDIPVNPDATASVWVQDMGPGMSNIPEISYYEYGNPEPL